MKTLLFFGLLFTAGLLNAQVLVGTVVDKNDHPIAFASIEDSTGKELVRCDYTGCFMLDSIASQMIQIRHPEYETQIFRLEEVWKKDTVFQKFVLRVKIQYVEEVQASSERLVRVSDEYNANVLDYLPFDNFLLVLKTVKRDRFLTIEGVDTLFQSFDLGEIKATSLELDCFGNVQLLTKDSAYQIWIEKEMHIIATTSLDKYIEFVQPCIFADSSQQIFTAFTRHNKNYNLVAIDKESKKRKGIYHSYDRVGARVASSWYYSIIAYYNANIEPHFNVISLGVWDGDVMKLNLFGDFRFDQMVAWYKNVVSKKIKVSTFSTTDSLLVFDQFKDSVYILDKAGNVFNQVHYSFAKGSIVYDIVEDRSTGIYYNLYMNKGVPILEPITPSYEKGAVNRRIEIREVPFAENIKVHNNWVYFLFYDNDYKGLYRIKIPTSGLAN